MDVITPRNDDQPAAGHPEGWWRARDGQWYPPERRPNPLLVAPEVTVVHVRTSATRRDLVGLGRRAGIGLAVIVALVGGGSFLRDGGGPVATMSQTLSRDPAPTSTTVPTTMSSVPDTTTTPAATAAPTADAAPPTPTLAPPTTVPAKASKRSRTVAPSAPVAAWPAAGDAPSGPVSQPSGPVAVVADGPAPTTPPATTPPTTTPPDPPTTVAPAPAP